MLLDVCLVLYPFPLGCSVMCCASDLIARVKIDGERGHPCLVPLCKLKSEDSVRLVKIPPVGFFK